MSALPYLKATDRIVGKGHPELPDTANAALRSLLIQWGFDPDGTSFPVPGSSAYNTQEAHQYTDNSRPAGVLVATLQSYILNNRRYNWKDYLAAGDGTADDRGAIVNADAAIPARGEHYGPAGTYLIGSNLTISKGLRLEAGAMIKPANGVVVTILGNIAAPNQQIFDLSAGGSVSFIGNTGMATYKARWFGVVADGVTDDQPNLTKMVNMLPNAVNVDFDGQMTMALGSTWTIANRVAMTFRGEHWSQDVGTTGNIAKFKWIGAAGATMIFMNCVGHSTFSQFDLTDSAGAAIIFDNDQLAGGTRINTHNTWHRLLLNNAQNRSDFIGFRNSSVSQNNCEFMRWTENVVTGPQYFATPTLTTTAGSNAIVATSNDLQTWVVGGEVRIPGAGAGGAVFVSTITARTDTGHITVVDNVPTAVTGVASQIEATLGKGIYVGNSPNVHRCYIGHNTISWMRYGIYCAYGNFNGADNNLEGNGTCYYLNGGNLPTHIERDNCEFPRQYLHITTNAAQPVYLNTARVDVEKAAYGQGFIQNDGGCRLHLENINVENNLAVPQKLFDIAQPLMLSVTNMRYGGGFMPQNVLGLDARSVKGHGNSFFYSGGAGAIADNSLGQSSYAFASESVPAIRGDQQFQRNFNCAVFGANSVSGANPTPRGGDQSPSLTTMPSFSIVKTLANWAVGFVSTMHGQIDDGLANDYWIGFWARGQVYSAPQTGVWTKDLIGLLVTPPERPTGINGSTTKMTGVLVEPLSGTGASGGSGASQVSSGVGIDQQGKDDHNYLRGQTMLGTKNAAPDDSLIENNQVALYLDETNGQVKIRARKSDATLHTVALPWDVGIGGNTVDTVANIAAVDVTTSNTPLDTSKVVQDVTLPSGATSIKFTVGAGTNGQRMKIVLRNNTGGTPTVTWALSQPVKGGFQVPANGFSKSREWQYLDSNWEPVGGWSEDY